MRGTQSAISGWHAARMDLSEKDGAGLNLQGTRRKRRRPRPSDLDKSDDVSASGSDSDDDSGSDVSEDPDDVVKRVAGDAFSPAAGSS